MTTQFLIRFACAVMAIVGLHLPAQAQDAAPLPPLPNVIDARVTVGADRARLVVDLAERTAFSFVSLDDPQRLAIDVRAGTFSVPEPQGEVAEEGLVSAYAVEQASADRVRTTLTLTAPAQVQQAYVLDAFEGQPARLVVDIIPATAEEFTANVEKDRLGSGTSVAAVSTPAGGSELPIDSKPLVVIDPGHGGIDSGAETPEGIKEKDIVLAFSLRLQELLVESGRFDVALTRQDDTYLRLEERVELARVNKANLFISIHADSFQQPEIRGASIYTRDENATDVLDKVLADNENATDVIAGFAMPQTMAPEVVDILLDLMRREMRVQSFMAAQSIVHQLEPSVALRRFPVRQADFFVLQAPDVPSVLVELGFLSNASDIANLMQSDWRDRTAEAIARGISTYFDSLEDEL
ncbi:N-acetylmuramoyl-L-alanine amidase [Devosia lucknowensis]|uniref:N-acetylmuramoyl-L-alanine amidase n=1 Tax=Devosia lucknowensis TaxID=1096929 RepID=A0A1Y6EXL4_9HYPH|nr:N-acetylmuramoyl-L-alanine amidase [Devosia lucknowensis]SMQ65023.1 N-acetylmuramoyl-L-alanine amidase [Devosia lucknowensis]